MEAGARDGQLYGGPAQAQSAAVRGIRLGAQSGYWQLKIRHK